MRNPEATKKLIITKAVPLFNKKGYRATSISDITTATGMTKGAIYSNFDNKDHVAVASFQYVTEKILGELGQKVRAAPTAPDKLKAILDYHGAYIDNPPVEGGCPIVNTSVEADDEHPLLRKRAISTIAMLKDSLQRIVNRGIREGQLKKDVDAELFAHMFYATIEGAILIARVEGSRASFNIIQRGLEHQIDAITR